MFDPQGAASPAPPPQPAPGETLPYAGPLLPPSPEPPSPPAPRSRVAVLLSWAVILGTTGLILLLPLLADRKAPPDQPNIQFKFAARYAIGVKALFSHSFKQSEPQLRHMIDQAALGPTDKVRAIMVIGELEGKEAALKRINDLQEESLPSDLADDVQALLVLYNFDPQALDPARREALLKRHEWFAQLALTYDKPDSPEHRALLASAQRVVVVLLLFLFGAGLGLIVGLILLILVIIKLSGGSRPQMQYEPGTWQLRVVEPQPLAHYRPDPNAPTAFLESFALYLGGFLCMSFVVMALLPKAGLMVKVGALAIPVCFALFWPRIRGVPWAQICHGFGLVRGRGWLTEAFSGVVGYVTGLPLLALGLIITLLLSMLMKGGQPPSHPIVDEIRADPWSIIKLYLLASVWAPITEELMFRGAFLHYLRARHRWIVSTLIVSFIFAAIHPQGLLGIPVLMIIALILSGIREWRGSIVGPMVAHALHNAAATTLLILMLT